MEKLNMNDVVDTAQTICEETSECIKNGAGCGIGKYAGAFGIVVGVAAAVYGVVSFAKSKSAKKDLVITAEEADGQVDSENESDDE